MTTPNPVQYELCGRVAVLTLDDPPANTYTHEMMRALDDCILKARFDEQVQVIVLTGQGEKFFCAGANIGMLEGAEAVWKYYFCLHANETLSRLEQTPKLVMRVDGQRRTASPALSMAALERASGISSKRSPFSG